MDFGFVKVAAAVPELRVADCGYNTDNIIDAIIKAESMDIQFVAFPELSITAYTCGDLFHQQALLNEAIKQLGRILEMTKDIGIVVLLGMPLYLDNQLFNCGVVIQSGRILGVVPKIFIPGYGEYYEERWFTSGSKALSDSIDLCGESVAFGTGILFEAKNKTGLCFGLEICEDLWAPIPPSSYQALSGAVILFNLSASNEIIGKHEYRQELVRQQSAKCIAGYVYASSGIHESTTDVVYGGHAMIGEYGTILAESERFKSEGQLICSEIDIEKLMCDRMKNTGFMEEAPGEFYRKIYFELKQVEVSAISRPVYPYPFAPADANKRDERCRDIFAIQTTGLFKRFKHTGIKHAVIGVSGGLDSALALLVTAGAFDKLGIPRENINAVTMPGFGTSNVTYTNANELMKSMKVGIREIDIKAACIQHFKDIGHDPDVHDTTYENVQARERTQILMDIANKLDGLVVGTGDLSELALGWCTYNGDHMSMYGVNSGVPKTLVRFMIQWVADHVADKKTKNVLQKILNTPISPELLPLDLLGEMSQKTEDIIGPYELHDFFLYHMIRYGAAPRKILFLAGKAFNDKYPREIIKNWLKVFYKRFFSQQFKRSCLPDGPKVGTISLSPRGDWRMPSDAKACLWLKELEDE